MNGVMELEFWMRVAIGEAEESLREGNKGFGAVIIKDGEMVAAAHDYEETEGDATSHAEINAIKIASQKIGKNLNGCILISTSEPCPMCAFAIAWSGISEIAFGFSGGGELHFSASRLLIRRAQRLLFIKVFCGGNAQFSIVLTFAAKLIICATQPMKTLRR